MFLNVIFINHKIFEIHMFEFVDQIWKRWAPTNDEDPFNKFLEIFDMGSISS